ncbi:hypothetical protein EC036_32560 [Enterobacter cloacae]|jgi:hypothetical protein|nr:hypothetical protein EC036_32560 [Enterobacter cloacae]
MDAPEDTMPANFSSCPGEMYRTVSPSSGLRIDTKIPHQQTDAIHKNGLLSLVT